MTKTYRIVPVDVREMVSRMETSQLVTAIAVHAARVEMARRAVGPPPDSDETDLAQTACCELDVRVARPPF